MEPGTQRKSVLSGQGSGTHPAPFCRLTGRRIINCTVLLHRWCIHTWGSHSRASQSRNAPRDHVVKYHCLLPRVCIGETGCHLDRVARALPMAPATKPARSKGRTCPQKTWCGQKRRVQHNGPRSSRAGCGRLPFQLRPRGVEAVRVQGLSDAGHHPRKSVQKQGREEQGPGSTITTHWQEEAAGRKP